MYFLSGSTDRAVEMFMKNFPCINEMYSQPNGVKVEYDDLHFELFGKKMPDKTQSLIQMLESFLRFSFSHGVSRLLYESNIEMNVLRDTEMQERLYFEIDAVKSALVDGDTIMNSFVSGESLRECLSFAPMNLVLHLT